MGWLIALGIVAALAILPLGVSVKYHAQGTFVWVILGAIRIPVFPRPNKQPQKKEKTPKETKQDPPPKEEPAQPKQEAPAPLPEEKGGSWTDFLPLVNIALDLLGDFRRKLRVNHLQLHMTMAADDPCDLAVNYGRANAALAGLLAQLDRLFVIKKQDVHLNCDFTAEETTILARLDLTITVGRLLSVVVYHGFRALITFLKIKKHQEGGANL